MFWKNLIADLRAKDLSQADIAALALCGQATISDLAKGETGDPRHALGQRLIALSALPKEDLQDRLKRLAELSVQPGQTPSSVVPA